VILKRSELANPPSKGTYKLSTRFTISNSAWEQAREPNPSRKKKKKAEFISFKIFRYLSFTIILSIDAQEWLNEPINHKSIRNKLEE
jgi:hypothetical protein